MASSAAVFGPSFACTNSDVSQRIFFGTSPPNNVHTEISSTFPSQAFLSVSNALTTKGAAYKLTPILASNKVFSGVTTKATAADAPAATESALVDVPPLLPQQKIRIKLRSYWTPRIQEAVRMILEAAKNTDAKIMGPVPLPTKRRLYCVLTSPHVDKDAREHFEIRTHRRLIDILNPTPRTIDALMQLDIPAGVDIEVKL